MQDARTRDRYVSDNVSTASPARLLTMLYDRLVRDLAMAEQAITTNDHEEASRNLLHAQDIVTELRTSLRMDTWPGAESLATLYAYILGELIKANIAKDALAVNACRKIVEPLREAWHDAAHRAMARPLAGAVRESA